MSEATLKIARLPSRRVLSLSGTDARSMLQGIVSNDVDRVSKSRAIWAALLTPQGKYLHDFFVCEGDGGALWLDCEAGRMDDLEKRLKRFKLRADVALAREDGLEVAALYGGPLGALDLPPDAGAAKAVKGGSVFVDPRLALAGARAIIPAARLSDLADAAGATEADTAAYDRHRLALGLPDGSRDMDVEKTVLLEAGFDELNGVDWNKGCYMGQEVTARTYHRGLVKRRLVPVVSDGAPVSQDAPVTAGEKEVGHIKSVAGDVAMALIRLDALEDGAVFDAGGVEVKPRKPDWANF